MKQPYSDYVRHCLQHYTETAEVGTPPKFKNNTEKEVWLCCRDAISRLTEAEQEIAIELYTRGDTIPDKIFQISRAKRLPQQRLWRLVEELEYDIAQQRGLIW